MKEYLKQLLSGRHLDNETAASAMHLILSGKATAAQIGGFLTALNAQGETVEEMAGLVTALRERSLSMPVDPAGLVDICGTGGDGKKTFNISTAAAVVAAGAGVKVAKHINRAVSSLCGSADVLLALGIKVDGGPKTAAESIKEVGIGCMFGPIFHPTLSATLMPRRELGFQTVFDLLLPLVNPAGARRLALGVYPPGKLELLTETLARFDFERVVAFSSEDGLDELSLSGKNRIFELAGMNIKRYELTAAEAGLTSASVDDLAGGDTDVNAVIIADILDGREGPYLDAAVFNAGAAIYAGGAADSIQEGVTAAVETIRSGKAREKLEAWKAFSKRIDGR